MAKMKERVSTIIMQENNASERNSRCFQKGGSRHLGSIVIRNETSLPDTWDHLGLGGAPLDAFLPGIQRIWEGRITSFRILLHPLGKKPIAVRGSHNAKSARMSSHELPEYIQSNSNKNVEELLVPGGSGGVVGTGKECSWSCHR